MIVVFPFCQKDVSQAIRLLSWCAQLGGCEAYHCVLVADAGTSWTECADALGIANRAFRTASIITNESPVEGWIPGSASLFFTAAKHIEENNFGPWLWVEPDAVPLESSWLDAIAGAYAMSTMPFMGQVYRCDSPSLPRENLSGIAVYPEDAWTRLKNWQDSPLAFDVACAYVTVPNAANTGLIQHYWGDGLPLISKVAVLFHRCKDGTVIRRLRKEKRLSSGAGIVVVVPVCRTDAVLAVRHSQWLAALGNWDHDAVISCDPTLAESSRAAIEGQLQKCFKFVSTFRYPPPPVVAWPQAPNWAFQHTALHMAKGDSPWLWLEPDTVVLRPDWLELLQDEYERCGKALMGPVVPNSGHVNGVAVYPADMCHLSPGAMNATDRAFDYEMKPDMQHNTHDASRLMQHFWSIADNQPNPNNGEPPSRITPDKARRWIDFNAALVHRIKDTSLVDLLITGAV